MRAAIAALFAAGAAVASYQPQGGASSVKHSESVVYTTKLYTVTSCGPEVTNCPAHSTVVVTSTEADYTTVCPVTETESVKPPPPSTWPQKSSKPVETTTVVPVKTSSKSSPKPTTSKAAPPPPPPPPACSSSSVKTISTSVTTVVPTVIYSTVSVPCASASASWAKPSPPSSASWAKPSVKPSATWSSSPHANTTAPKPVTAGAGSVAGSVGFAAVAGLFAVLA